MSLLPTMGSLMATQDTNKQLSSIRSYLSQLQESMEAELMNIGIDNLSGELKKKLEQYSDDIQVATQTVDDLNQGMGVVINIGSDVTNLKTSVANINTKITNINTSITNINTDITNINTSITNVNTSITNINTTISNYNTVVNNVNSVTTWMNYANGSKSIPSGVTVISGGSITTGTISAARISSDIFGSNTSFIDWIYAKNIKLSSGVVMYAAGADRVFSPVSMNGYYVLATPQPRATTQSVE